MIKKNFLSDYGLIWVGEKKRESIKDEDGFSMDEGKEKMFYPADSLVEKRKEGFVCDFDLMIKNLNELNSLVDFNEPKIVDFASNGAKFETAESIKLTLFSNGIALYEGPFRPFTEPYTQKFCIDIMDGYFPSELQSRYPDGVGFNVVDKRDIVFNDEKNSVFNSKGYRLGSEINNTLDKSNIKNIESQLSGVLKKNFI